MEKWKFVASTPGRVSHAARRAEKRLKPRAARLADPEVTLSSFIVSNTPHQQVKWWADGMTMAQFKARNVLFQSDERDTYIHALLHTLTH